MSVEIKDTENVVIIGSGPAGYTAALYTSRADLEPLLIEGFAWGGLLQQTTDVENYPGYPEGVMGPEMMQDLRDQAERFGTRFITDDATKVELSDQPGGIHVVHVGDQEIRTRAVVLAMGAEPKKLGVPGEDELAARGVSYCATCDAAFFRDHDDDRGRRRRHRDGGRHLPVQVRRQSRTIVHRRPEFRASAIMLQRAKDTENIELLTPYVVERFEPGENGALSKAVLENTEDGVDRASSRSTARSSRSATARTRSSCEGQLDLDDEGYVLVDGRSTRTKLPGVFAAGDLTDRIYRQAVTAAGTGCHGRARRGGVPARHADRPGGPLGARPREGRGGGGVRRVVASRAGGPPGRNWARDQRCAPERIERPAREAELAGRVAGARAGEGRRLGPLVHRHRVHRWRDGRPVAHEPRARRRRRRGHRRGRASRLRELGPQLAARGLAMENQGDVDPQTLAGAISHRHARDRRGFRNLSAQVTARAAGHGRGRGRRLARGRRPAAPRACRSGRWARSPRSRCAAFRPSRSTASTSRARSTTCSRGFDELVDAHDHFELFVFPYTRTALTLTSERTDREPRPPGPVKRSSATCCSRTRALELAAGPAGVAPRDPGDQPARSPG